MIKPGTLCMIRGCVVLPQANGQIVVAKNIKGKHTDGSTVWLIEPSVVVANRSYNGCREHWLHPLDNPSDDLVDTHSTRKETA